MKSAESLRPRTWVLPPVPYAVAMVGGWWLDRHVARLPLDLGAIGIALAYAMIAAGVGLFGWALATLRRHRTTVNPYKGAHALCTDGPFALSRNPIYLGDWFVLAGVAFWLHSVWPLLLSPMVWLALRFGVIGHEERHLEAKFGDDYRSYMRRVRRWI